MVLGIADPVRFLLDFTALYAVYMILSVSLNFEYGYLGIPNFGKVLFFAGGAFIVGGMTARFVAWLAGIAYSPETYSIENVKLSMQVSQYFAQNPGVAILVLLLAVVLAIGFSALLGLLASYPAIRLREDYLGITLLAMGELLRVIARNYEPWVCGTFGVAVPDPLAWVPTSLHDFAYIALMLSVAFGVWLFTEQLARSPFGRMLRAIRDNEVAAAALGKDVVKTRMKVLIVGSAMAGLAGALHAFYTHAVHPDDYMPIRTFLVWVMVILGGAGNNAGAMLGALIYTLIDRLIAQYKYAIAAPFDVNYLSYVILGIVLILVLMYKPEGILPEKPSETIDFSRKKQELEQAKQSGRELEAFSSD